MNQDIPMQLLDAFLHAGADDVVVALAQESHQQVKFARSKIQDTKSWGGLNASVFLAKDRKIIVTSIKDFQKRHLQKNVEDLMTHLNKLPKNPQYLGIAHGPFKYKPIPETYDPCVVSMDKELAEITIDAIDIAHKKVSQVAGIVEKTVSETELVSSGNVHAKEKGTSLYFSFRALANDHASGQGTTVSRIKKKFQYSSAVDHAVAIALDAAKFSPDIITGRHPVLFEPSAFAHVLENFGEAASVFSVEAGLSCLGGKKGKRIADSQITMYDDAKIPNGFGSEMCDEEGYPAQKTCLIKKGIFQQYLHNTSTARRYKEKTTGNAGLIAPAPHNIFLKPGNAKKEELFSSLRNGVYITNVWYTRFQNHSTGDYSTLPRDGVFFVKNGKIVSTLKNIRVSDNILGLMKRIRLLGKKVEQIKSWEIETPCFLPHVLVDGVMLTKPQ